MSETSRIRDRFDRFMEIVRQENQKGVKYESSMEKPRVIGYFNYDFQNQTETYTPLNSENPTYPK